MSEFERKQDKEIEVLFYDLEEQLLKVMGIKSLLPFVFAEERLMINKLLKTVFLKFNRMPYIYNIQQFS